MDTEEKLAALFSLVGTGYISASEEDFLDATDELLHDFGNPPLMLRHRELIDALYAKHKHRIE